MILRTLSPCIARHGLSCLRLTNANNPRAIVDAWVRRLAQNREAFSIPEIDRRNRLLHNNYRLDVKLCPFAAAAAGTRTLCPYGQRCKTVHCPLTWFPLFVTHAYPGGPPVQARHERLPTGVTFQEWESIWKEYEDNEMYAETHDRMRSLEPVGSWQHGPCSRAYHQSRGGR